MTDDITYQIGWRLNDEKLIADVAAFLRGISPEDDEQANENDRAAQLAIIAYAGQAVVAVSMLDIRLLDRVKQKFAFIRVALGSGYEKDATLSDEITQRTRDMIEAYAESHPEEGIFGMAAILKKPGGGELPVLPAGKLALIGYTVRKEQVRVGWFGHVVVRPKQKNAYS
tara:strand:- start:160795 stop:161304 length:510 start_codon:yes stop_codon:yes gene_type:complete